LIPNIPLEKIKHRAARSDPVTGGSWPRNFQKDTGMTAYILLVLILSRIRITIKIELGR